MLSRLFLNNSKRKMLTPHALDIAVIISLLIASLRFSRETRRVSRDGGNLRLSGTVVQSGSVQTDDLWMFARPRC